MAPCTLFPDRPPPPSRRRGSNSPLTETAVLPTPDLSNGMWQQTDPLVGLQEAQAPGRGLQRSSWETDPEAEPDRVKRSCAVSAAHSKDGSCYGPIPLRWCTKLDQRRRHSSLTGRSFEPTTMRSGNAFSLQRSRSPASTRSPCSLPSAQ